MKKKKNTPAPEKISEREFHTINVELTLDRNAITKLKAYARHNGWIGLKAKTLEAEDKEAVRAAVYYFIEMVMTHS